ncbi:hypothetical protein DMA11_13640 [Marinilabiliaceae bacterium JC017]|nr:hypothetical protein DMA11_13640 [Marinilabiliaceae bacterium JC017]
MLRLSASIFSVYHLNLKHMKHIIILILSIASVSFVSCGTQNKKKSGLADQTIYTGYLILGPEAQSFTECKGKAISYWINGNTISKELSASYEALSLPLPYSSIYVELTGSIDTLSPREGFASQYDGLFTIDSVVKAEALSAENDCDGRLNNIFDKTFESGDIAFRILSATGSLSPSVIIPSGFEEDNAPQHKEVDGSIQQVELTDLNSDGYNEIICFTTSAGSGSYGDIWAFASNKNKSISEIYLQPLSDPSGYMGHDRFYIEDNRLKREFPLYKEEDTNNRPTAGKRIITYQLEQGEAGWLLTEQSVQ